MKSHLTQYVNYRDIPIPPEFIGGFDKAGEELLAQRLVQDEAVLLKRHMTVAPGREVKNGSIVTISISSALPKFNRARMPVTVGLGLYSPEVEAALMGKAAGAPFSLTLDGQPVSGQVLDIAERHAPASVDEVVFSKDLDGADNYDDWRTIQTEIFNQEYEVQKFIKLMQFLADEIVRLTDPVLDQEELDDAIRQTREQYQKPPLNAMPAPAEEELRAQARQSLCLRLYSMETYKDEPLPVGQDEEAFYNRRFSRELNGYIWEVIRSSKKEDIE